MENGGYCGGGGGGVEGLTVTKMRLTVTTGGRNETYCDQTMSK